MNGSPRKNGDTAALVSRLSKELHEKPLIVNCYEADISACTDCRYCRKGDGCALNDDMTKLYDIIAECENLVIASPLHYSMLTAELLKVASRFQMFFSSEVFAKKPVKIKPKKGGVILTGGGSGSYLYAEKTARLLLKHLNAKSIFDTVVSFGTDVIPAKDDEKAIENVRRLAEFLNLNTHKN